MGVEIERIRPGDGKTFPQAGDTIEIHYIGKLANGTQFDSSRDRGGPFKTQIGTGRVIRGWDEGVPKLSLGEIAKLSIPSELAYGAHGMPPTIPKDAALIFEVELLKIN
ncbi:FKBP-type peptidyl-prolyl cis-trans isomerase [Ceratobasidium sp. AG-Ba]|nr:FKBP-type peptidyl-prolyl cis-trans isomerase [Ceratobasidium sp. AG-Ba]